MHLITKRKRWQCSLWRCSRRRLPKSALFLELQGLSYGVPHKGPVLHTGNYGHRDVGNQLAPTSDTRYAIESPTKAFTTAAVGILVQDGTTTWEASVRDIMGDGFHFSNSTLTVKLSVLDVLSHRMGLQRSNQLRYGNDNKLLLQKSKVTPHMQYLKTVQEHSALQQLGICVSRRNNREAVRG